MCIAIVKPLDKTISEDRRSKVAMDKNKKFLKENLGGNTNEWTTNPGL